MSGGRWLLILLLLVLVAVIVWFLLSRRGTSEVPGTVDAGRRDVTGSTGAGGQEVGAGGPAALPDGDVDLDSEGATQRTDVDSSSVEVYDRTAEESVSTTWDAPDANAPSVAPEVEVAEATAPHVESPGVAGGAAGTTATGAAGVGAASWSSRGDEAVDVAPSASSEPVRFAGVADTSTDVDDTADVDTSDADSADVDTAGLGSSEDFATSSDAEIIEAEADLETPAAPTGEADWSTATGADSDLDADVGSDVDSDADSRPDSDLEAGPDSGSASEATSLASSPTSGPRRSVMSSHDAGDLAAAKEPVIDTSAGTGGGADADTSSDGGADADAPSDGGSAAGVAGLAGAGAAGAAVATGKFGKGSAEPNSDGSGPSGWAIKGNEDSMLFHTQDSPSYKRTRAEVWFEDEDTARKAGFTKWNEKNRSGRTGGAAKLAAIPEGKFGKGSADPNADGSGPEGWTIKGDEDSNLFHTQESPYYGRTKAEIWFDTEDSARGAGFVRWDEKDRSVGSAGGAAKLVEIPEGRFGQGSADPGDDGSGPDGWAIKGNENSMLFHTEDSPAYGRTKAEVWFQDEEAARKAGFTKWNERNR